MTNTYEYTNSKERKNERTKERKNERTTSNEQNISFYSILFLVNLFIVL